MLRPLATALILLSFAACAAPARQAPALASLGAASAAAQPVPAPKKKDIDDSLVCTFERQTGSNIPEKVCRRRTTEEERQRTQDMLRRTQSHPDRFN